jgi:O-antigen/teichoic acid export membrane protein
MGRYLVAVVEQAFWSLLNLGVNLSVAHFVSPEQFGAFIFWTNLGFVLASLQNALTLCHVSILPPGEGLDPERLDVERLMHAVTVIFLIVTAIAALAASLVWHGPFAMAASALFLPAYLLQQYLRTLNFSRGKAVTATVQTGLVLVLAALFLGVAILTRPMLDASSVLLCLTAAYGLIGVAGAVLACGPQLRGLRRVDLRAYGAYALQSGWVFLGVTTTEMLARFYTFIVAAWYGPRQLAILAATNLLLRPLPLLAASWGMVARPDMARHREEQRWSAISSLVIVALAGGAVIAALWTVLIAWGWPTLADHLFSGKYREFAWMVALWGLSAALNFGQTVVSTALQVLRAFKSLALANAAASATAALAIVLIMSRFGYAGAIAGTAAGQVLELAVMAVLLAGCLKSLKRTGL